MLDQTQFGPYCTRATIKKGPEATAATSTCVSEAMQRFLGSNPTLLSFGFGWAENLVQAALKAVPLGQSAGQRMLSALAAALPSVVDGALALSDDQRQAFMPMFAIHSSRHETQYSRLFRS